jgi:PIF1-like helicase
MRSANRIHNEWLLKVGAGILPELPDVPVNSVVLPEAIATSDDLIAQIFTANVVLLSEDELAKRVILAPTNKDILAINNKIIQSLPGLPQTYYSVDSIVSEDPTDVDNFPAEFLHEQTPSGMPPHLLLLKVGAIIMLIRNLNSEKGLCNGARVHNCIFFYYISLLLGWRQIEFFDWDFDPNFLTGSY